LQVPEFRRLFTGQAITVVGAQLTVVAVPAQIYGITGSSAYVGLTGVFGLVPLVVFGLWGGSLADHLDRRRLMTFTTVGLIVSSAALWLQAAADSENVWLLLTIYAAQQACFAVNQPTRSAILPRLVPVEQLPAANSLNMTVFQAGGIAGPLVGGALIPVLGYSWLYLVDSVTLLATLLAVVRLPSLRVESARGTAGWRSVVDGFRYLRGHPVLMMSFVVDIIAMVFGMPRALFPALAINRFDGGAGTLGLMYAAPYAGALISSLLSGWIGHVRRQGLIVAVAAALWGVAIAAFGFAETFWLALLLLAAAGAADNVSAVLRGTILWTVTPDALRGRVSGIEFAQVAATPALGNVEAGLVASLTSLRFSIVSGGLLCVVGTVVVALAVPAFTRYDAHARE
jgi:MFS family permease